MAGWIEAGPVLLRLDIAEKVTGDLGYRSRRGPTVLPSGLASRFAIKPDMLPAVLHQLGFRVLPAVGLGADQQGPPGTPHADAVAPAQAGGRGAGHRRKWPADRSPRWRSCDGEAHDSRTQTFTGSVWTSGWRARVMRARTDCAELVAQGAIRINRQPTAKPHGEAEGGRRPTIPLHGAVRVLRVAGLAIRRGPAAEARLLDVDIAMRPQHLASRWIHRHIARHDGRPRAALLLHPGVPK